MIDLVESRKKKLEDNAVAKTKHDELLANYTDIIKGFEDNDTRIKSWVVDVYGHKLTEHGFAPLILEKQRPTVLHSLIGISAEEWVTYIGKRTGLNGWEQTLTDQNITILIMPLRVEMYVMKMLKDSFNLELCMTTRGKLKKHKALVYADELTDEDTIIEDLEYWHETRSCKKREIAKVEVEQVKVEEIEETEKEVPNTETPKETGTTATKPANVSEDKKTAVKPKRKPAAKKKPVDKNKAAKE